MNLKFLVSFLFIAGCLLAQDTAVNVTFSSPRGFYNERFDLTVSADVSDAKIRYTIDGSDPSSSSTAIINSAPVIINIDPTELNGRDKSPGFIVRACVEKNSIIVSEVVTHSYYFIGLIKLLSPDGKKPGPAWPDENVSDNNRQFFNYGLDPEIYTDSRYSGKFTDAFLSIPTISLVTDLENLFDPDSGIYVNAQYHGIAWERPVSAELINPDGTPGFHVNAGLRIRGGWSRHNENPKHAFRLMFRSEYGAGKLDYPLFGDEGVDEFNKIDLRTSQNYSWSFYGDEQNIMNRDVFSRDTQREMGQSYTRSRYYHLFINGTYWGLFQTQERSEASYAEEYFGGLREDYDVVKIDIGDNWNVYTIEATDGNLDAWKRLWDFCNLGFETDEAYYKVQGLNTDGSSNPEYEKLVDIDNLIDYMLCTFYTGDFDGPVSNFRGNAGANNFYAIYNRNNPNGFIFIRHDAEHTLVDNPWGLDRTGPFSAGQTFDQFNPQWLHQRLAVHPEYRLRIADRAYKYFFDGGILTPEASTERFLSRKDEIDLAIIAESARWGDSKRNTPRTRDDDWLPAINHIVNDYFPSRTYTVLEQLLNQGWYPDVDVPVFSSGSGEVSNGFKLSMSSANGTIYYTTDGSDPHLPYSTIGSGSDLLISADGDKRVMVPTAGIDNNWNSDPGFDDSGWNFTSGTPGGVGYEQGTGYENYISYDIADKMYNDGSNEQANTSCYIRIPFTVNAEKLSDYTTLTLGIRYDDGFIAYLNGSEVARINAPATSAWNSLAQENHEAAAMESFDLSEYLSDLTEGDNLLAIQGLNVSNTSSDFLVMAQLVAGTGLTETGVSPGAKAYTESITISEHSFIKARTLLDNNWSALNEVNLWVEDNLNHLLITEIHYHPLARDSIDDKELEFVELKNTASESIDLSRYYFQDGIDYTFAPGTIIGPGSLLVLASNSAEFEKRYGFAAFGEYSGQLKNSGETIVLNNAMDDTLIVIDYNDKYPWPKSADGSGYSLVLREDNPTFDANDPANWKASNLIHGNPGLFATTIGQAEETSQSGLPEDYQLMQNYPNPFNGSTRIKYILPKNSDVTIKVFNILGQYIKTLLNENQAAGNKTVSWDGKDRTGKPVSSGIYIYRMEIGNKTSMSKRMLYIK